MRKLIPAFLLFSLVGPTVCAEDNVNVDTTHIKASKELPKVLYVIPWKDIDSKKDMDEKIVLPELFGDLYEPVLPENPEILSSKDTEN